MMRPQIGDTVYIKGSHRGFAKGRTGKVMGYMENGRVRVRIGNRYWDRVRPENLVPLLDVYEKEAEK